MSEEGNNINEIYSVCNSIANNGEMTLLKAGRYNTTNYIRKVL